LMRLGAMAGRKTYEPSDVGKFIKRRDGRVSPFSKFSWRNTLLQFVMIWRTFAPFENHLFATKELTRKRIVAWSESGDFTLIKKIAKASGFNVTTVIYSCLAGAIVRFHRKRNRRPPSKFPLLVHLASQDVSDPLRPVNDTVLLMQNLPLGKKCTPLTRLGKIYPGVKELRPEVIYPYMMATRANERLFSNYIPAWFLRRGGPSLIPHKALIISNVPGPNQVLEMDGHKVACSIGLSPYGYINSGHVCFTTAEGNTNFRFAMAADSSVIKDRRELDELISEMMFELQLLASEIKEQQH